MADNDNQQLEKKFFEYLPRWAWGFLACFMALGFVMNTLGLNFAAPLNIMAIAQAEAYKQNLLNPPVSVDTSALEEEISDLGKQVKILVDEVTELKKMAHPPGNRTKSE